MSRRRSAKATVAPATPSANDRLEYAVAAGALVLAILIAYAPAWRAPFVFDDRAAILDNPTLRDLSSFPGALAPPAGGTTVSGRPLVNLSLAINYAFSGQHPAWYHGFNVGIHAVAALLLAGLLRRIWAIHPPAPHDGEPSRPGGMGGWLIPLLVAAVWALHPLQTSAVAYVVQRAESMAALFGLLTLYAVVRSVDVTTPTRVWSAVAVLASLAAAACKETALAFPLLVLCFDRAFLAEGFRALFRRRGYLYSGLASSWLLSVALIIGSNARGGTVGDESGMPSVHYLATQAQALVVYLKLVFWPAPLVFDYGTAVVTEVQRVLPQFLLLAAVGIASVVLACRGRWRAAFPALTFFLLLAPSSSVVPIATQTMAEHRMYLASAVVIGALCWFAARMAGRYATVLLLGASLAAGIASFARVSTYQSEVELWGDTVAKRPQNARAHANLAAALLDAGRIEEAVRALQVASARWPGEASFHASRCLALTRLGRLPEAIAAGERAVALDATSVEARIQLAHAHLRSEHWNAAVEHARIAVDQHPEDPGVRSLLVESLVQRSRIGMRAGNAAAGVADARAAVDADRGRAESWFALGNAHAAGRDLGDAVDAYRRALEIEPTHLGARNNLANALLVLGRLEEAVVEYERVLRERPRDEAVRANLEEARRLLNRGR